VNTTEKKFSDLYEKNHREIYRFIYRHISDEDTASDIMQDTFINFMKIYRDKESPEYEQCRMYLYRTARNLIINHQSSYYNRKVDIMPFSQEDGSKENSQTRLTSEENYIKQEILSSIGENLKNALHNLSEKERTLILLRYNEEYSLEKIAGIMGISVSTAHRFIKKAERSLISQIKDLPEDFQDLQLLTEK
jgi:RNA polymerase sigma-70 factor, ECF subfamily